MKRIGFIIVLIIAFLNIDIVMADGCGDVSLTTGSSSPGGSGEYFGSNNVVWHYKVMVNGKSNSAICHNPGVPAWNSTGLSLQCKLIGDPTNNISSKRGYDAGIVYILKNISSSYNQWLAINFYQLLFPVQAEYAKGEQHSEQTYYFKYQVNRYLDENNKSANAVALREKLNILRSYSTMYKNLGNKYVNSGHNESGQIDRIIQYVLNALDAAIKASGEDATNIAFNKNPKRTKSVTDAEVKQSFTYRLNVSNFSEKGEIHFDYKCTSGCEYVTSTKFYLNGQEISESELNSINLLNNLENSGNNYSGQIELKIEFVGPNAKECSDTVYSLKLKYRDERLGDYAYDVSRCSKLTECQSLYVLANVDVSKYREAETTNRFKMCQPKAEVDSCKTYISDVSCSTCNEDDNKLEIKEGYDTDDVCTAPTEDQLNIKKCVVNEEAKDSAGNKRKNPQLTSDAGENNFTYFEGGEGIYCKEDYTITFPGSRKVDSGRYFTLRAKLEGTEKCFTSRIKDKEPTIASVKGEAANTVKTYKEYSEKKALLACLNDTGPCVKIAFYRVGEVCRVGHKTSTYTRDPVEGKCNDNWDLVDGKCKQEITYPIYWYKYIPGIGISWDYEYYDSESCAKLQGHAQENFEEESLAECHAPGEELDFSPDRMAQVLMPSVQAAIGSKSTLSVTQHGDIDKGSGYWTVTGTGATGLTGKLGTGGMYSILKDYNKVVGYYTEGQTSIEGSIEGSMGYSGTGEGSYGVMINPNPFGGWKMNYNYNPDLHFWYDQNPYMNEILTDTFIRYNDTLKREAAEYCIGDVSDDYETCEGNGGWKKTLSLGAIDDFDADVYQGESCACTPDGCKKYTYAVSNVKYIKQSQKAESKFVTPTQFYNIYATGKIVVAEEGTEIENGTPLENGLPVALNTPNGPGKYILYFEHLGEYYQADSLGRIWGDSNSVISTTLLARTSSACVSENSSLQYDYTSEDVYLDEGLYVCQYDVNICGGDGKCQTPSESKDNNWHCTNGEVCSEEEYNRVCPNPGDNATCQTPSESEDNNWHCANGEVCSEEEYKRVCPDPGDNATCQKPYIDQNGQYTYTDNHGVLKTKVSKATYEADCCPDGKCPTDVINKCAIGRDASGNPVYYDNNGTIVSEAVYNTRCCPKGKCGVYCPTCLYNGQSLMVDYRQITNEDVNPNDRQLGKNWEFDSVIDSAIELKAKVTTEEIQNNNNAIFDIDFSTPSKYESNDFAMQVKMNMQTMSWIRNYNREHDGYLDGELKCYDLKDPNSDRVYKNIYCYSEFIDRILSSEVSDNVKIIGFERPGENARSSQSNKYFTNWIDAGENNNWEVSSSIALEYTTHFGKEYNESTGKETDYYVGPSWK